MEHGFEVTTAALPEGTPSVLPFEHYGHEEEVHAVEVESVMPLLSPQERKKAAKQKRERQKKRQQEFHQQMAAAAASGAVGYGGEPNEALLKDLATKYARQRFPIKLWNLASDEQFEPIKWADEGASLIIDEYLLEPTLKYFFRSAKFSSFLRQLHLYGFRKMTRMRSHKGDQEKVRTDYISEYGMDNSLFLRDNLEQVKQIRRFYGNFGESNKKVKDEGDDDDDDESEMMVEQQLLLEQPPLSTSASPEPLLLFQPSYQQGMPDVSQSQQIDMPMYESPVFYFSMDDMIMLPQDYNIQYEPFTVPGSETATATATCASEFENLVFSIFEPSPVEENPPEQEKMVEEVKTEMEGQLVIIKEKEEDI